MRAAYALVTVVAIGGALWVYIGSMGIESTDDAYVNGRATFVAPRVGGQVSRVLVDDNNRVHRGDLLVELDSEPYRLAVSIARAAVSSAEADVNQALAQARAIEGRIRSARFALQRAVEDLENQVALLRSRIAALELRRATLNQAKADYERVLPLADRGSVSAEEVDHRKQAVKVTEAEVEQALQQVYQVRVSLGLPLKPENGDLGQVPPDLGETFSAIRQAQANLIEAAAAIGVVQPFSQTPREMIAEFYKRDPEGNLDRIYDTLLQQAPTVTQARAKMAQAQRNLDQAELDLRYCEVVSEIDGAVVRRNVNPGNNVVAGQELMVVRSLTEVWVDANFKETQLARMRIGQPVDLDVDMYGGSQRFRGRVAGFAMGTGSTLALLPAENATGNFVKVVQRLPVRIDLLDYNPDTRPLFVGLSVTPRVHVDAEGTGPDAGSVLQGSRSGAATPSAGGTTDRAHGASGPDNPGAGSGGEP